MVWIVFLVNTIFALSPCDDVVKISSLPCSFSVNNEKPMYLDKLALYGLLIDIKLPETKNIIISTCGSYTTVPTLIYEINNCTNSNIIDGTPRSSGGCGTSSRYNFEVIQDTNHRFYIASKLQSSFSLFIFEEQRTNNQNESSSVIINSIPFYHEANTSPNEVVTNVDCIKNEHGNWYEFIGDGNEIQFSVCNSFASFDTFFTITTKMEINGTEIYSCLVQDDNGCGIQGLSFIKFNTTRNSKYFLIISGIHGSIGSYFLQVTSKRNQFSCVKPRKTILPQTISTTIQQDDAITLDPSGTSYKGLWMTMDGYNLMIYVDACPMTSNGCNVILGLTTDCVREQSLAYDTERGNGLCAASFYGRSGQVYKVKASTTNISTCELQIKLYETNELPPSYNIWLLICTAIFGALIIITATTSIIYAIIKRKRMQRSVITDVELQVVSDK